MLARLFRYGRLSYHGAFVTLRNGHTTSLPINPAVWQGMMSRVASDRQGGKENGIRQSRVRQRSP